MLERFYADEDEIVVLVVDTTLLGDVPLREERGDGDESFPHLHGPLDMAAVVRTVKLRRVEGRFPVERLVGDLAG